MELRRDYFVERWAIIAQGRASRPNQLEKADAAGKAGKDFFAPGNENLTPPEIGRRGAKNWTMRWFENKFPAVQAEGNPDIRTDNGFTFADAVGRHEIIVETPSSKKQLWDLPRETLTELFTVYNERIAALSGEHRYVSVFKNHGPKGGASLPHSHSQVIATKIVPPQVEQLATALENDSYQRVIDVEKQSTRRVFENEHALAFTPYCSTYNYELLIFPKGGQKALAELSQDQLAAFTDLLHQALQRLKTLNVSYNYALAYDYGGTSIPFHVRLMPRIASWAGFELSSGIVINTIPPEQAAAFYRGEQEF